MIAPKILRTEADYEAALEAIEALMDAQTGSPEEEMLELFALLIGRYEQTYYPIDLPDPIEAIKFRMEQAGLTQREMIRYLGSQSKVSEVLHRKRPLSLTMIRALHEGLGIPAEVLLHEPGKAIPEQRYAMRDYPFAEMLKRGYFAPFRGTGHEAKARGEALLIEHFSVFEGRAPQPVCCRHSGREIDTNALIAWQAQVLKLAHRETLPRYEPETISDEALHDLVRQSYFRSGPLNARELLNRWGVHLITHPHLPRTYLDGAAFLAPDGHPVIGLTLRHDRLDNFWFTLLHELAHVRLHLDPTDPKQAELAFFDETDGAATAQASSKTDSLRERHADDFARENLVPARVWEREWQRLVTTTQESTVLEVSNELQVNPAIVAGRIRSETGDYKRFSSLVGHRHVREHFVEYKLGQRQE